MIQKSLFPRLGGLLLLAAGAAAAGELDTDKPGAADHPLVSRYAGSTLYQHGEERYGTGRAFIAVNGKPVERTGEGRITNRMYFGPKGASPLEIFRNYQAAFRAAGYDVMYQCEAAQCQKDETQAKMVRWVQNVAWTDNGKSDYYIIRIFEYKPGFHYIHVRRNGPDGPTSIQVALRAGETQGEDAGRVQQFVQVVEPARVEQGKVTVDARTIDSTLKSQGRIALYGVLFDTNQAVIKPGSADTLFEMAKALKNDPGMNVYIVGHTDNVGNIDANMALSRKRAQAVSEALSKNYGIAASRLQAFGVASLSPTALNTSEDGRAKNRRVEMVAR